MGAVRQGRALGQSSKQASKRADRQTDDFGPGSGERCRAESSAIQGQNVRHAKGAAAQRTKNVELATRPPPSAAGPSRGRFDLLEMVQALAPRCSFSLMSRHL